MDDNPYRDSMERKGFQNTRPPGRMFVVGFLLLALGEAVQIFVRFRSPSILSDLMTAPGGIRPSDIAEQFQRWTMMTAIGGAISLLGVALLLYSVWKHLAVRVTDRKNET